MPYIHDTCRAFQDFLDKTLLTSRTLPRDPAAASSSSSPVLWQHSADMVQAVAVRLWHKRNRLATMPSAKHFQVSVLNAAVPAEPAGQQQEHATAYTAPPAARQPSVAEPPAGPTSEPAVVGLPKAQHPPADPTALPGPWQRAPLRKPMLDSLDPAQRPAAPLQLQQPQSQLKEATAGGHDVEVIEARPSKSLLAGGRVMPLTIKPLDHPPRLTLPGAASTPGGGAQEQARQAGKFELSGSASVLMGKPSSLQSQHQQRQWSQVSNASSIVSPRDAAVVQHIGSMDTQREEEEGSPQQADPQSAAPDTGRKRGSWFRLGCFGCDGP